VAFLEAKAAELEKRLAAHCQWPSGRNSRVTNRQASLIFISGRNGSSLDCFDGHPVSMRIEVFESFQHEVGMILEL